jgi:hypothetical protein
MTEVTDDYSCMQNRKPSVGVDSASNRNEYQECFLGVKMASALGWQPYHIHVLTVLKSGSLNILEPLGPVQACNGIALPLPLPLVWVEERTERQKEGEG